MGAAAQRIPAIAVSGKDDPALRERVLFLGADAYLTKPIDGDDLLAAITLVIRQSPAC